jgi:TRAP-type C4-dicarboxylate transport system permease small subunit
VVCEVAVVLLFFIILGLIGLSAYLLMSSMDKPIWDRLPYWVISAILIIASVLLVFLLVEMLSLDTVVEWCEQ